VPVECSTVERICQSAGSVSRSMRSATIFLVRWCHQSLIA
jgi:hypothetical protein